MNREVPHLGHSCGACRYYRCHGLRHPLQGLVDKCELTGKTTFHRDTCDDFFDKIDFCWPNWRETWARIPKRKVVKVTREYFHESATFKRFRGWRITLECGHKIFHEKRYPNSTEVMCIMCGIRNRELAK